MLEPATWGPAAENLMAATLATLPDVSFTGFWRKNDHEVDGVWLGTSAEAELVEAKTTHTKGAVRALARAAEALRLDPTRTRATLVVRDAGLATALTVPAVDHAAAVPLAQWLGSWQRGFGAATRSASR